MPSIANPKYKLYLFSLSIASSFTLTITLSNVAYAAYEVRSLDSSTVQLSPLTAETTREHLVLPVYRDLSFVEEHNRSILDSASNAEMLKDAEETEPLLLGDTRLDPVVHNEQAVLQPEQPQSNSTDNLTVLWDTSQIAPPLSPVSPVSPTNSPPILPSTSSPPVYPGNPSTTGTWMMIWVPHGDSTVPPVPTAPQVGDRTNPDYVPTWGVIVPMNTGDVQTVPIPTSPAPLTLPAPAFPSTLVPNSTSTPPSATTTTATTPPALNPAAPVRPITEPRLDFQGLYILQADTSSARARLSGDAFLTPNLVFGGALDFVTGSDLTDDDGVQLTELYLATSVSGAPGLRFRLGQLDLTSYFDRNSFAKDIARDFFNPAFHTNPALIAGANVTASRPAGLVQWAVTDDIAVSAAAFSSAPDITDFSLDGFAGEVSFRVDDNFILRGTFVSSRDTEFQRTDERLNSYGVNAEWFFPDANLGLFGRYGHLDNEGTGLSEDTYSFGISALDLFMEDDRLGLAYGRDLSTTVDDDETPDVFELFYDFEVISNIRLGVSFQQRNDFQDSYAGFRIRGDFNIIPGQSLE